MRRNAPNGEVPRPLRAFVSSWRLGERFDHGIVEGVIRGLEVEADEMDGLAGGAIGLGVAELSGFVRRPAGALRSLWQWKVCPFGPARSVLRSLGWRQPPLAR